MGSDVTHMKVQHPDALPARNVTDRNLKVQDRFIFSYLNNNHFLVTGGDDTRTEFGVIDRD